jgi:hypothetical protein
MRQIYASFPFCIWGKLVQKRHSETHQRSYLIGSRADWVLFCFVLDFFLSLVALKEKGYGYNMGGQGLAASLLETCSE